METLILPKPKEGLDEGPAYYFGSLASGGDDGFASGLGFLSVSVVLAGALRPRVDMRSSSILSPRLALGFAEEVLLLDFIREPAVEDEVVDSVLAFAFETSVFVVDDEEAVAAACAGAASAAEEVVSLVDRRSGVIGAPFFTGLGLVPAVDASGFLGGLG
jgi:hypothetical protein